MIYTAVEYEPGEMVFHEGEEGSLMYLVQGGEVEVLQDLGGIEKQIAVLERGDFFGEMSILEKEPRTHSVRAISAARLIKIDRDGLMQMLVRNPEITVRIVRKLSHRLTTTEDLLFRAYASVGQDNGQDAGPEPLLDVRGFLIDAEGEQRFDVCHSGEECSIGRLDPVNEIFPDVDLTSCDPQVSVSRRHARILRRGNGFQVVEEQATNGTYLNSQRISTHLPIELRSGDEIMFGAVKMRFAVE